MKKQVALLLCLGMVFLTACQRVDVSSSSSSAAIPESSSSSQAASSTADSAASSSSVVELPSIKLAVPIQIAMQNDNPAAYAIDEQQTLFATQRELDSYRSWLAALDGSSITALYGESVPVFEYSKSTMSMADSQAIFDKLLLVAKDIYPFTEEDSKNPYTGGGWSLAIHAKDGITILNFNGGWLVVQKGDKKETWVFNLEDTEGQELCNEIGQMLYENMDKGAPAAIHYQGSKLERLYAINKSAYLMSEVESPTQIKEILGAMEGRETSNITPNNYGYLIINGDGKQYQYLSDRDADTALNKNCLATLTTGKLHPSWLIHMTPDRLVSANGVTDKEKLLALSTFLKEDVTVNEKTSTFTGSINPNTVGGLFDIRIKFDSGTVYTIIGYDYFDGTGDVCIHASDLDSGVYYELDKGVAPKITKFLESFA